MSPFSFDYLPSGRSAEPYSTQAQYNQDRFVEKEYPAVNLGTENICSSSFHVCGHDCWQNAERGDSGSTILPETALRNSTGESLGVNSDDATNSYSNMAMDVSGTTKIFLPASSAFQQTKLHCDPSCSYHPSSTYQAPMSSAEDKDPSSWFIHDQGSPYDSQMTYQSFEYDDHTNDVEDSQEQYYDYYKYPYEQTWSPTLTDEMVYAPLSTDCWPAETMTTETMDHSSYTKEMPLPHQQGDDAFLEQQWYEKLPRMDPGLHPSYAYQTGPSSYPMYVDPCAACNTPSDFTSSESPLSPLDPETCYPDSYSTLSPYSSLAPLPAASSASSSEPAQNSPIPIHAPRPTRTIPVISFERLVAASKTLDH